MTLAHGLRWFWFSFPKLLLGACFHSLYAHTFVALFFFRHCPCRPTLPTSVRDAKLSLSNLRWHVRLQRG
eukprot:c50174_g1_i1 orf=135-344(+)